ncbi:MAG: hypothetical protein JNK64_04460 [Myxococcales bacterium]|nr:hypothetical protein [Myxococcales bacterium]
MLLAAALVACGEVSTNPVDAPPASIDGGVDAMVPIDAPVDAPNFNVTVTKAGGGDGTITSAPAGIDCGATCTAAFSPGTTVTLTAAPAVGSTFLGWTGGACTGTGTCTVTGDAAITAQFAPNNSLLVVLAGTGTGQVVSTPAGINCGVDCMEAYAPGTMVTLLAAPTGDSHFTGWSGGGCAGTGTCVVTLTAATMVTATFDLNTYTLTVARAGTGTGTVTSSPAGISCGADCTESYNSGTTVTLTAVAANGSTFSGWSGAGCSGIGACTVLMTAARSVTATFALSQFPLTVTRAGTGVGTVTSSPAGISCGADCSENYNFGTAVVLTAAANSGSTFAGWSGACTGTGTCTVTIAAATSVTATFTLNRYTLTTTLAGTGSGTVTSSPAGINCGATCSAMYDFGTVVTLTAAVAGTSTFAGYTGGGCGTSAVCNITITANTSVTATFTGGSVTYGNVTDLGGSQSISPNYLLGSQVVVTTGGTLQKFGIISRDAGPRVRFGLYTNVGGNPGTLVAQTATAGTALAVGVQELNPTATVSLPAGTYWLFGLFDVTTNVGGEAMPSGVVIDYISLPFANPMPSSFGAPQTYTGSKFNYYLRVQ